MAAPDDAAVLAALRELIQPDNLDELSMNKVMKALHGKFGKGVWARKPWVSEQVAGGRDGRGDQIQLAVLHPEWLPPGYQDP
jgi:hypothetical protein